MWMSYGIKKTLWLYAVFLLSKETMCSADVYGLLFTVMSTKKRKEKNVDLISQKELTKPPLKQNFLTPGNVRVLLAKK